MVVKVICTRRSLSLNRAENRRDLDISLIAKITRTGTKLIKETLSLAYVASRRNFIDDFLAMKVVKNAVVERRLFPNV